MRRPGSVCPWGSATTDVPERKEGEEETGREAGGGRGDMEAKVPLPISPASHPAVLRADLGFHAARPASVGGGGVQRGREGVEGV
eukprot:1114036-Rhodomonas_salina.1